MKERFPLALLILGLLLISSATMAQYPSTNLDSYSLKIFRVESGLYPFVQVYFRTFNQDMEPLVNLNELNTGGHGEGSFLRFGEAPIHGAVNPKPR